MTIQQSEKLGIAFVHQELNLFNDLKVYENIFLMKEYKKKTGALDKKRMIRETQQLFTELGVEIEPEEKVENLKTSQKQLLEISKALFFQAKLLILDEPTSSLDEQEVTKLFGLMRDLKARGVGIIFVTHFLDQVYEVCDKITVMRDGSLVGEYAIKDLPRVQLVSKMLGKELDDLSDIKGEQPTEQKTENGEPLFETKDLCSDAGIRPFDFYIKKG